MIKTYFTDENQFLMTEAIGLILTEQLREATGNVPMLRCLRPDMKVVAKVFATKMNRREDIFEMTYRIFEVVAINHNLIVKNQCYNHALAMMVGDVLDDILKYQSMFQQKEFLA